MDGHCQRSQENGSQAHEGHARGIDRKRIPFAEPFVNRNDSVQINILRFPLMVGVIFSHAYSLVSLPGAAVQVSQQQPVAMFIESTVVGLSARLATPLFFLFSAYLLYHGEAFNGSAWAAKLKNRVSRLGVPYLCWNGAIFAMYFVGQSIPQLHPFFTKPEYEIADLDWWERVNLLLGITRFPIDYQFWFIRDLLLLVAVSPVLWLAMRYVRIPAIALLVLLWGGLLGDVPLPFASRTWCSSLSDSRWDRFPASACGFPSTRPTCLPLSW